MTARIGVVGVGWWATFNHIPTVQAGSDAQIVALCDLDAQRLQVAGDRFGIAARYTDLAAMLAAERLDGLMVSTPHVAHTAPALAGLAAGCHVLVEKPIASTVEEGREIVDAARRAGSDRPGPSWPNTSSAPAPSTLTRISFSSRPVAAPAPCWIIATSTGV